MTPYPHVERPIALNGLVLKNRIFVPAHTTNFGEHHLPSARHVAYHRARARGGAAAIIFEAIRVCENTLGRPQGVAGYDRTSIEPFRRVADAVHEEGIPLIGQICHMGRQIEGEFERTCSIGPSPVRWSTGACLPREMSRSDMDAVREGFVRTSLNMLEARLDGLELHWGHGHLLQQFLSPSSNVRTDVYGGSLENRMRFPLEVLIAVRGAIGSGVCMGIRFSVEEFLPVGIDVPMAVSILDRAVDEVQLDFVHVTHSAYNMNYSVGTQMADMGFDKAVLRGFPGAIRDALHAKGKPIPVMTVCRYTDLAEAEHMIEQEQADLVGMARAHIADPEIVNKSLAGHPDDVRTCIACNQGCAQHLERNIAITCLVNPAAGREALWKEPADDRAAMPRSVLVVGGGPAGIEAARVAAARGHRVTLWEASDRLGGQLALAPRMRKRENFQSFLDAQRARLDRNNVTIELNHTATAEDIRRFGADLVVLATGSRPTAFKFPDGTQALTIIEALTEPQRVGRRVAIHDETGDWPALAMTEHLALQGHEVIALSPLASFAWRTTIYSTTVNRRRLRELGVRIMLLRSLIGFKDGRLSLEDGSTGGVEELHEIDTVIAARLNAAWNPLEAELSAAGVPFRLVGDCLSPRTAVEAVYEGHAAGRLM